MLEPHARVLPSMAPSQSLSRLSQSSAVGPMPVHAPAPFVDHAVAVVVETVADLGRHRAARAARVCHAFVDAPVAVVVDAVAELPRVRAERERHDARGPVAVLREALVDDAVAVIVEVFSLLR